MPTMANTRKSRRKQRERNGKDTKEAVKKKVKQNGKEVNKRKMHVEAIQNTIHQIIIMGLRKKKMNMNR